MIKIVGITLSLLICILLLRQYNRSYAVILSIVSTFVLFLLLVDKVSFVINSISDFSHNIEGASGYIKIMLKTFGIIFLSQIMCDICRDNGESSIASMVEICSKFIVIALVMPIFNTIISVVTGLLK